MSELLAPAGDLESGYAAFAYGADAVYLGLRSFSARAEATNFSADEFAAFTDFAHKNGKKVLTAVNTVFFENEKDGLIDTLGVISDVGADGVIVQDLGTFRLMRKYFPNLRPHASTQMAVHNREGVETLRDLGFKRVVLARELTLDEIRDICSVRDIEKEVFVHGALCYGYSGLCLFSSIYAGRSANRGKCVYPCREAFKIEGETKHVFSMKDMAQGENVLDLQRAGVTALKIEGRKKSPLYVAAVTDYYRSLLNGEKDKKVLTRKMDNIRAIFSRPTTSLYLKNRKNFRVVDPDVVGHRGVPLGSIEKVFSSDGEKWFRFKTAHGFSRYDGIQIDLENAERPFGFSAEKIKIRGKNVFEVKSDDTVEIALPATAPYLAVGRPVYLASSGAVKKSYPCEKPKNEAVSIAVADVFVSVSASEISVFWKDQKASVAGNFTSAKNKDLVVKSIRDAFEKTGGTGLTLGRLEIDNPDGLFVPMSVLNELRRDLYAKVAVVASESKKRSKADFKAEVIEKEKVAPSKETVFPQIILKTDDPAALWMPERLQAVETVFEFPADIDLAAFGDVSSIRWALPTVIRGWETDGYRKKIAELVEKGAGKFEVGNMGGLALLKKYDVDFSFDWHLYVANTLAAKQVLDMGASRFTVSPETKDPADIFACFPDRAVALVRQEIPLFISETCPFAALHGECEKCGGNRTEEISSRYGKFLSVMKNCRHFLLADKSRFKIREAVDAGAKLLRADFMYRKNPAGAIADAFKKITSEIEK